MKNLKLINKWTVLLVALIFTLGCKEDEKPVVGEAPVADAGADIETFVGFKVTLDGSNSSDAESDTLIFSWELKEMPSGSKATLSNASKAKATFTPDEIGDYVAVLTVEDTDGNKVSDEVVISAASNENAPETVVVDADITEDTTWESIFDDPDKADYHITSSISVKAELTIKPGVKVIIDENVFINVKAEGLVNAVGTSSEGIVLTSSNITGGVHWGGILFESGYNQNELTFTEVSYAGSSRLFYYGNWITTAIGIGENGKLTLKNSTVTHSKDQGLYVAGVLQAFENNTFKDNISYPVSIPFNEVGKIDGNTDVSGNGSKSSVRIYGSTMSDDQSMVALANDQAYRVTSEINLESKLNIGEGVQFAFDEDVFFRVLADGNIIAEGTDTNKIVMTSSNISGGLYWGGLDIGSGYSTNKLNHVEVSYAGNSRIFYISGWRTANVGIQENGKLSITNSIISNGKADGVYCGPASLNEFSDNKFENNSGQSIVIEFNDIDAIDGNTTFSGNKDNGITVYGSKTRDNLSIVKLAGSAYYLFTGDSEIDSDVEVAAGATLRFNEDVSLTVNANGSLKAIGTSDDMITFTSSNISGGLKWTGLLFTSKSALNELNYVEVSHGGSERITYMSGWRVANIAISEGKLKMNNCEITDSEENGIIIGSTSLLNGLNSSSASPIADIEAANTFANNAAANVLFL